MFISNIIIFNFFIFLCGLFGIILNKQNLITLLMSIELILISININFIVFSIYLDDIMGQLFSIFILTIAASEAAIGLAIIIIYFRLRGTISMKSINLLFY